MNFIRYIQTEKEMCICFMFGLSATLYARFLCEPTLTHQCIEKQTYKSRYNTELKLGEYSAARPNCNAGAPEPRQNQAPTNLIESFKARAIILSEARKNINKIERSFRPIYSPFFSSYRVEC